MSASRTEVPCLPSDETGCPHIGNPGQHPARDAEGVDELQPAGCEQVALVTRALHGKPLISAFSPSLVPRWRIMLTKRREKHDGRDGEDCAVASPENPRSPQDNSVAENNLRIEQLRKRRIPTSS